MFDIGASELLLIAVVAILVIGPKDMPAALRQAGRWIGKVRRVSAHFRSGLDTMIREAEMEEMDRKWREQNEAIMARSPSAESAAAPAAPPEAAMRPMADPQAHSDPPDGGAQGTNEHEAVPPSDPSQR